MQHSGCHVHMAVSVPDVGGCAILAYRADLVGTLSPSLLPMVSLQEFNLEKLTLLEQEKAKIRKDYERREAQVEVKKKM